MDPLSALRSAICANRLEDVTWDEASRMYFFPAQNLRFSGDAPTAFREKNATGPYYTLRALHFYMVHNKESMATYTRLAGTEKVPRLSVMDKTKVLKYLSDPQFECENVDPVPPPAVAPGEENAFARKRAADGDASSASPLKRARTGSDVDMNDSSDPVEQLRRIFEREQQLSTRDTVLQSAKHQFGDIINRVSRQVKADEKSAKAQAEHAQQRARAAARPRHDRYQTVEEESFAKQRLGIDKDLADIAPLDARAGASGPSTADAAKAAASSSSGSSSQSRSAPVQRSVRTARVPTASAKKPSSTSSQKVNRSPIIIVPAASTAIITLANAREFLENSRYLTPAEAKKQGLASPSGSEVVITHGGKEYVVVDNPELVKTEWDRVVAIFCLGKQWQLNTFPEPDAVKLFNNAVGLFLKFEGTKLPDDIKDWRVSGINLSKEKEHVSQTAVREIFKLIDTLVATPEKSKLFPSKYYQRG